MRTKLTPEQIQKLLAPELSKPIPIHPRTQQVGPLRYYDHEMRCLSPRCGSSTYLKVDGIPRCQTHALRELNQVVVRLTERIRSNVA